MSRTDQEGAFRVAHRICAGVEALSIEHPQSDVSTPAVDLNWEELALVAEATDALERAKKSGRNRVSINASEQPADPGD